MDWNSSEHESMFEIAQEYLNQMGIKPTLQCLPSQLTPLVAREKTLQNISESKIYQDIKCSLQQVSDVLNLYYNVKV